MSESATSSSVHQLVLVLADMHLFWILLIAGFVLILIDYLFPVDWTAYVGYVCMAGAMFFAFPLAVLPSVLASLGWLVLLLVLHFTLFSRFLTNAGERNGDGN